MMIAATFAGVALLVRRRRRSLPAEPLPPDDMPHEPLAESSPEPLSLAEAAPTVPPLWMLPVTAAGFICLIGMQAALLASRQPLPPLLLFVTGLLLIQPMFGYFERVADPRPALIAEALPGLRNRALYGGGAVFFAIITFLLTVSGVQGSLWLICWGLSIFAVSLAVLKGAPLFVRADAPPRTESLLAAALALVAGVLQLTAGAITISSVLAAAAVPAVYVVGRVWRGPVAGLLAGALAAVSGWLLALGHSATLYPALAIIGAVYAAALLVFDRRRSVLLAGLALGLGTLIHPFFVLAGGLIPLAVIGQRPGLALRHGVLALLVALVVMVPGLPALRAEINTLRPVPVLPDEEPPPANPQLSPFEGLTVSLLMFNLTSDPNALHGIVNRPVLGPVAGAALLVGLMGIAWRWQRADTLLLAALIGLLLPSALNPQLPVRYPNLQAAAGALPVALVIGASALADVQRLFAARLGRRGTAVFIILLLLALGFTVADWQAHFRDPLLRPAGPEVTEFIKN